MDKFQKTANISYFIADRQVTFFCYQSDSKISKLAPITKPGKPGVFQTLPAQQAMLMSMWSLFLRQLASVKNHKKIRPGLSLDTAYDP